MEKKDRPRFKLAMDKTSLTLPGPNLDIKEKALRIEAFWEAFRFHKIDDIEQALSECREDLKFFPTPRDVIERANILVDSRLRQEKPDPIRVEWSEPTEEGKRNAKEITKWLYEKWDLEDKQAEEDRNREFEESKLRLKKQAKLIEVK